MLLAVAQAPTQTGPSLDVRSVGVLVLVDFIRPHRGLFPLDGLKSSLGGRRSSRFGDKFAVEFGAHLHAGLQVLERWPYAVSIVLAGNMWCILMSDMGIQTPQGLNGGSKARPPLPAPYSNDHLPIDAVVSSIRLHSPSPSCSCASPTPSFPPCSSNFIESEALRIGRRRMDMFCSTGSLVSVRTRIYFFMLSLHINTSFVPPHCVMFSLSTHCACTRPHGTSLGVVPSMRGGSLSSLSILSLNDILRYILLN